MPSMDTLVKLAKETIAEFLNTGRIIRPPDRLPEELKQQKAGVFVSLHKKPDHGLHGCIGTFLPTKDNLAEETIANAVSAAFSDPRFPPLEKDELDDLEINVDVLSEPKPVKEIKELNPKKYGLLVRNERGRSGLLLPDIGVKTVEEQIAICCQKASINPKEDQISLFKFTVERHK